jgi:hypothetical protein
MLNNFLNSGPNKYANNLHENFIALEKAISITPKKKKKAVDSMFAIQEKLVSYFTKIKHFGYYNFDQQGSYKMNTMVLGKDNAYDIDFGIHSIEEPSVTSKTLKQHIYNALSEHTQYGIVNKDKCVRVIYSGDFDIDVTAYYKTKEMTHPMLATNNGWQKSDPKKLIEWFKSKNSNNGQLTRLVKYLKYWANTKSRKMPSGIALTVLVANNFKADARDDLSFYYTLKNIYSDIDSILNIWNGFEVINPTTPNDNLVKKLDKKQLDNFKHELNELIVSMKKVLDLGYKEQGITLLKTQFGSKFI